MSISGLPDPSEVTEVRIDLELCWPYTPAGGLEDMLPAVTCLSSFIALLSYGIELANSFQLCITNENLWEVNNTHSVPSL